MPPGGQPIWPPNGQPVQLKGYPGPTDLDILFTILYSSKNWQQSNPRPAGLWSNHYLDGSQTWRQWVEKLWLHLFRQQLAAGSNTVWSEVNPSLMASTALGMGIGPDPGHRPCTLCMGSDHWQAEFTLNSLEGHGNKSVVRPVSSSLCLKPYKSYDDICCRFNRGSCSLAQHCCKYDHTCNRCYKPGHGAFECPKGKGKSPVTESVTFPKVKP